MAYHAYQTIPESMTVAALWNSTMTRHLIHYVPMQQGVLRRLVFDLEAHAFYHQLRFKELEFFTTSDTRLLWVLLHNTTTDSDSSWPTTAVWLNAYTKNNIKFNFACCVIDTLKLRTSLGGRVMIEM